MSEELKPCPFCGIKPMTFNQTGLIICAYSMCGVNPESKSREDWNNRTADRLQQENTELREALKPIPQTKEVEWANGDECRYANDIEHEYTYIGEHPHGDGHYVFSEGKGITYIANGYLLEPETPEQKLERERVENGKSLYELVQKIWCDVDSAYTAHPYESGMVNDNVKEMYARLAIETNYKVKG